MTSLITGVTGFVGGHLAEHLLAQGDNVIGISRSGRWPADLSHLAGRIELEAVDQADPAAILGYLQRHHPERIYNLVGQAHVAVSVKEPERTWRENFEASRNLYDAVLSVAPPTRVLQASTGLVYGRPQADDPPINESTQRKPETPYAQSKLAADDLIAHYVSDRGLNAVILRPFNQLGPRQQSAFAIASFARQIAEMETRDGPATLSVGRLDVLRDFTDIRDAVRAYRIFLELGKPGEVLNLASGVARTVQSLLDVLVAQCAKSVEIEVNEILFRLKDPAVVRVSIDAIRARLGWSPQIPIETTLLDTLEYWRRQVRSH